MNIDAASLARALIRCASVTPRDDGAQEVLAEPLRRLGFTVTHLRFGEVNNLFAKIGKGAPHFCFAGHSDVVPAGDGAWSQPPFAAEIREGLLYGRGACDMKGNIAAFVAAAAAHLSRVPGSTISLLITGDEEGPATDGTARVLEWMEAQGEIPDFCLVGEPTCVARLGDVIKIGRRGSMNATLTVHGIQGHSAYPHRADNPVHRLIRILSELTAAPLDDGSDWFEPSGLQVTSADVGNPASNVIPAAARAKFNIRFNDHHDSARLAAWLREVAGRHADRFDLAVQVSGESFLTKPGAQVEKLRAAVAAATGVEPRLDTGGGTSDARFIARLCPVAEFGLVGSSMHQVDERVPLSELHALSLVYEAVLDTFNG